MDYLKCLMPINSYSSLVLENKVCFNNHFFKSKDLQPYNFERVIVREYEEEYMVFERGTGKLITTFVKGIDKECLGYGKEKVIDAAISLAISTLALIASIAAFALKLILARKCG